MVKLIQVPKRKSIEDNAAKKVKNIFKKERKKHFGVGYIFFSGWAIYFGVFFGAVNFFGIFPYVWFYLLK